MRENGISGIEFGCGSTGLHSFGDGNFYVSKSFRDEEKGQATNVCLFRLLTDSKWNFEEIL